MKVGITQGKCSRTRFCWQEDHTRACFFNTEMGKKILMSLFIFGFCLFYNSSATWNKMFFPKLIPIWGGVGGWGTALRLFCPCWGGQSCYQTSRHSEVMTDPKPCLQRVRKFFEGWLLLNGKLFKKSSIFENCGVCWVNNAFALVFKSYSIESRARGLFRTKTCLLTFILAKPEIVNFYYLQTNKIQGK